MHEGPKQLNLTFQIKKFEIVLENIKTQCAGFSLKSGF